MSVKRKDLEAGILALGDQQIPTACCVSEEWFERERERIFKRVWLNVGRVEEVQKPGDYVVKEIPTLKASVLVVRGKDDVIRAFHNVCRHRGNKLARDCKGTAKGFSCGFHGWTYDTRGELVFVPDEKLFSSFNKSEFGLVPLAADVWEGFIFINMDPNPEQALEDFLGEMGLALKGYPFQDMQMIGMYSATVDCNWKIFTDAVEEGFHVPFLHKSSYPEVFKSADGGGSCHLSAFRFYGNHHAASVPANPEPTPSPAEAIAGKYGRTLIQATAAAADLPPGINPERRQDWSFDINVFFPNFFVDTAQGWYFTYNFWPLSPGRTLYETKFYMTPAKDAGERIAQEYTKVLFRDVQLEDLSTVESAQKSIESGVLPYMPLCEQEIMLRHKYKVIEAFVFSGSDRKLGEKA